MSGLVETCVTVHQSVERSSSLFLSELRRYYYVTPTSYLELLTTFLQLEKEKRTELQNLKSRLETGLEKLLSTADDVEVMKKELINLQPVLAKTAKEVDEMMIVIQKDKVEADETKKTVQIQEQEANKQVKRH